MKAKPTTELGWTLYLRSSSGATVSWPASPDMFYADHANQGRAAPGRSETVLPPSTAPWQSWGGGEILAFQARRNPAPPGVRDQGVGSSVRGLKAEAGEVPGQVAPTPPSRRPVRQILRQSPGACPGQGVYTVPSPCASRRKTYPSGISFFQLSVKGKGTTRY